MLVADLPIPDEVKQILILKGIKELYPPQADAINTGVLEGKNLVLASPTASGKTLIAELCALKHVLERRGKVLYLSPLRALAWEKFEGFEEYTSIKKPGGGKLRVGVSTGDLDSKSPWLEGYDIVITTNEKCDSLLRHRSPWMGNVSLVIADEVHLIGDERGPTLEIALARLRQMNPEMQILALSATIKNADEVAEWLKANCVTTEWRPTKLYEGVAHGNTVIFRDGTVKKLRPLNTMNALNIAMNSVLDGGQALIFVESRRRAESMAREAAMALSGTQSRKTQVELDGLASDIEVHGEKTSLSDALSFTIAKGAAFHHAGLNTEHRRIVERAFKGGTLKILTATPTLAAGVNLPARTVVIGNYKRFVAGYGMYPITVLEYKQMSGRAGRPQYDPYGEAILIASSSDEQDQLMENYILADPERLYSRLAQESALRGHTLAAIASDYAHTEQGLLDFLGGTFYGFNYPAASIKLITTGVLRYLLKENMLEEKGEYIYATDFGRRVSELYIDPLTAVVLRDGLRRGAMDVTDFTWLHLICHTPDMRPILRPRRGDLDMVETYAEERQEEFAIPLNQEGGDYIERDQFLGEVKTAMVLNDWINEKSEADILEQHGVQPGDRYAAVHNAEWLLYSAHEITEVVGVPDHKRQLGELNDRVKHGVSKKLLPLVRLKGIGRVRARVLYNSGLTGIAELKRAPLQRLVALPLIGPRLAKSIKEQVGGLVEEEEWKNLEKAETEQKAITDFVEEKFEPEKVG
ncbi:MAG: DEAD/DEAH box helicase [Candidatus Bathyarchaeia archaeon]|jgi:helicase